MGMKSKYFENGLALAGALIVLVAVGAAANSALADETNPAGAETTTSDTLTDSSRTIAASANLAAASEAIVAVGIENKLDLDIRLLDRTLIGGR